MSADFESLRKSIVRSYDGQPRDETHALITENPEYDGTFIPNQDAWREFGDFTEPSSMPSHIGSVVCGTVYGSC